MEEVYKTLQSKGITKQLVGRSKAKAKNLLSRGRPHERDLRNSEKGISNSRGKYKFCKYCKKKGHVFEKSYELWNKNKELLIRKGRNL